MDLEQYRIREKLTYEELAVVLQLNSRRMARFYALGMIWPKPPVVDLILSVTKGEVTLEDMHQRYADAFRAKIAAEEESDAEQEDEEKRCSEGSPR